MPIQYKQIFYCAVLLILGFMLNACGSSSGSTPTTLVSGTVMAGPASGSQITVRTASGQIVSTLATTAADGSYTVSIPVSVLSGDLIFEASGGTYPDEATGATGAALGTLSAHLPAGTFVPGTNVTIDPASTIIRELIKSGRTRTEALATFTSAFGYTPDSTIKPVFACISSSSSTTQRLAGLRAAAFSQLANDLGIIPARQHELILALAEDLADGSLDGKKSGGAVVTTTSGTVIPADIGNRFAAALMTFQNSGLNRSKLTIDKIGNLNFSKIALTSSYKVEYIPGTSAAVQGKTSFQIRLTNLSNGTPATGKAVTLIPKMNMPGMSHSAPVDTVVESATPGTYDCTVYYLMASGPGMGIWELKVIVGGMAGESATFYPPVAMSMGSTSRATLKGITDLIGTMMGMGDSPRTYYIFNEGVTGMGPYTFKLFLAAADDSMMLKFPAVYSGATLHDAMNAAWTVDGGTSAVQVSANNGSSWVTATDTGGGHWSAAGLSGLATGGTIRVRVNINGEQKTTTGSAVLSASNLDYAPFTIVTGM